LNDVDPQAWRGEWIRTCMGLLLSSSDFGL
jgi:hypothetical protein